MMRHCVAYLGFWLMKWTVYLLNFNLFPCIPETISPLA